MHNTGNSPKNGHSTRNGKATQEGDYPKVQSQEHGSCGRGLSSNANGRQATNYLTGRTEIPFANIDDETRKNVERRTGRSLEQSYEGLMWKLAAAIEDGNWITD